MTSDETASDLVEPCLLYHISRSQQSQFQVKIYMLIWLSWNFVGFGEKKRLLLNNHTFFGKLDSAALVESQRRRRLSQFPFTQSKEIIDMFPDLTKIVMLAFHGHRSSKICQTLQGYKLAWGLPIIDTRFDDLDLVLRSQVCQNYKLLILFRLMSTVI